MAISRLEDRPPSDELLLNLGRGQAADWAVVGWRRAKSSASGSSNLSDMFRDLGVADGVCSSDGLGATVSSARDSS